MWDLCRLMWWALLGLFRLRVALVAENLALRQQINVLRRTAPKKLRFGSIDRLVFVGLVRGWPTARAALAIVQPDTVIRCPERGSLLALEIARGPADGAAGGTPLYPCEPCQPAVGRTADAWRTPQARHRGSADECGQVYGAQEVTTVSGLEDLSGLGFVFS